MRRHFGRRLASAAHAHGLWTRVLSASEQIGRPGLFTFAATRAMKPKLCPIPRASRSDAPAPAGC